MGKGLGGILVVAALGCGSSVARIAVLAPENDAIAVQRLRPGLSARVCRASVFGMPIGTATSELDEALRDLIARERDGTVVTDAEVRWHWWATGVYNRRCVAVRGDVGRAVSTVTLPGGHEGHR